jgi:hypothetical protein
MAQDGGMPDRLASAERSDDAHTMTARPRPSARPAVPGASARTAHLLLASLAGAGVLLWASHHPFGATWMLPVALLAIALFAHSPACWLWVFPALLPVIDLSPWTGWIHFTESDALALAVVAGVGLREALRPAPGPGEPPPWRAGPVPLLLFALLAASYAVSAWRTPIPLPPFDAALFAGYKTPLNGLRLLKGFVLALALIPALHVAGRMLGARAPGHLGRGLMLGLVTSALAATWERFAFPGLLNFSTDYRTTGLFWDMHVGGAALDAWIALTLPFALAAFLTGHRVRQRLLDLCILALATYVTLTTFSRGLYAGAAIGAVVLLLALRPGFAAAPTGKGGAAGRGLWLASLGLFIAAPVVFAGGGYRGLAALLGFAALIYLAPTAHATLPRPAVPVALLLGGGAGALAGWLGEHLPKGPYVIFGMLFFAALGASLLDRRRPAPAGAATALALTAAAGVAAAQVSLYWGEGKGSTGILAAIAAALALLLVHAGARPLWQATVRGAMNGLLVLGLAATVAAGLGSYYVGERFSTTSEDLAGRMAHWREGAALVRTPMDAAFGIGLGRYPEAYFWAGPLAGNAGSWQLVDEAGNRFSRLAATRHVLGFGELFRISQQVPADTRGPLHYQLRVRAPAPTTLHLEVCRKHLLYAADCTIDEFKVTAGEWTAVAGSTQDRGLKPRDGLERQPAVLSLAVSGRAPVDIDDVAVIDGLARPIVHNGDFQAGVDHWFFSSDRHHLPWHAKSLPLHVWIEQGALGLLAVGATLAAGLGRLAFGRVRRHPLAPPLLAGLVGFLGVGLFDSLLDMPRMTLSLFLMSWVALSLAPQAPAGRDRPGP